MLISWYTVCNSADALLCCTSAQADTFCMSAGVCAGFSRGMYIFFSHVSSTACMNTRLQAHVHTHVFLWNTLASMQALGKCSVRHYVDRCRCNASSNLEKPIQTSSFHAQSQTAVLKFSIDIISNILIVITWPFGPCLFKAASFLLISQHTVWHNLSVS